MALQMPLYSNCKVLLQLEQLDTVQRCFAVLQVAAGRRHVGIMGLELVGNYAVR
jgi:DUF971 family protein